MLGGWHPWVYMIIAVVSFSAVPVYFKLGNAEESPFLFTGIWLCSVAIGTGTAIMLGKKTLLLKPEVVGGIKSQCKSWLMLVSVLGQCGSVLFAVGLAFVDVSVAAILYETWPIFLMALMVFLFRGTDRYTRISAGTMLFVVIAFAGVAMVILGQSNTSPVLPKIGSDLSVPRTLIGAILVLVAAGTWAAHSACTLKMGVLLAKKHERLENIGAGEIVFTVAMTCIALVVSGIVLCVIGLVMSETFSRHQMLYAVLGAILVDSIGAVAFRAANLKTKDLGLNALSYATPLVALAWLWALSILNVSHPDYLVIGAMGIVASNLLINSLASNRIAYKALVVSLWVFGTVIYFTDGYATDVPLELPVTIFILVLAFRVERLTRRTSQEEGWMFEAFRRLELLAARERIGGIEWRNLLLIIDRHKTAEELEKAYDSLAGKLARHITAADTDRKVADEITHIRHLVDNLAHSRQQGTRFGEIVAIAMAGGLIVVGLLFFNGDREFYGEIVSLLLSSVVVFLFVNIVDLEWDRRDRILKRTGREFKVKFDDVSNREAQQVVSVVTSAVMVFVFAWLFTWG